MTWFRLDMAALEIVPVVVADVGRKFVNLGGAGVHPKAADDFSYYPTHADAVQVATKIARKRLAAARADLRAALDTYHRVRDILAGPIDAPVINPDTGKTTQELKP